MFSFIREKITNLFSFSSPASEDDIIAHDEEFLAQQLLDIELLDDYSNATVDQNTSPQNENNCIQRTGVVTFIGEDYCLIDGMFYCPISDTSLNVRQNEKICYLCCENKNGDIKVVRILNNLGPAWADDEETVEEQTFKVIEHVIIGQVDYRQDRKVHVKDNDLVFSLDEVEASFVPLQGDWLELTCSVQWDEDNPSDISPRQVVEVLTVKPLRTKIIGAFITQWNGNEGTCDRNIYFDKQSLQNCIEPKTGSKVILEAIESSQGACTWRAIKIIIDNTIQVSSDQGDKAPQENESHRLEKEKKLDVTHPLTFENIQFNSTASIFLDITNKSDNIYTINKWMVLGRMRDSQIIVKPSLAKPVKLFPQKSFTLTITCKPKILGNSKEILIISFQGFQIKRCIEINVENSNTVQSTTSSYVHGRNLIQLTEGMHNVRKNVKNSFIPGVRPVKPPNFIPVKLGSFEIPDKIWSVMLGDSTQTIYGKDLLYRIDSNLACLSSDLNITNYTDIWHTLLYMEEIQANISMRVYDMPRTFLAHYQEYLGLIISGLSERRPSLMQGDRVIAKELWDERSTNYEGYIHIIRGDLVLIKFNYQFHERYTGSDVSLEFHFSRSVYRRGHQAINLAISNLGPDVLFPSKLKTRKPQLAPEMVHNYILWYNDRLNVGQKEAVTNIILGECRPMPYCLYGPPGTGKTITLVETILQILSHLKDSRILVATPSNSAANLITERLIGYRNHNHFSQSVVRLIAQHLLNSDSIPDVIKPFCATLDIARESTAQPRNIVNKDGINLHCRTNFIGRHRVTIGTCYCIGSLAQMGLPKGHFTHVIIDEAGQATEPEIMIPLTFIDKDNGQIILAGDPMQLGPVVQSKYCVEYGLSESYLSRILDRFPYHKDYGAYKDGFDKRLVTKLTYNYRSLEEVLKLPSKMFYDDSLVPKIDRTLNWICNIQKVVSEIFDYDKEEGGIFVYGMRGANQRAEESPSWLNPQEASMVALTTCKLYKKGIMLNDIGIITPYVAQIKHIRLVFDAMGLDQPKIGTVEDFQGQERPIILISTVRSNEAFLQSDYKHSLGFVKDPKRVNVALTRAQVAALVFCNPHLLCKDQLWNQVIKQAVEENKYTGCDLPNQFNVESK